MIVYAFDTPFRDAKIRPCFVQRKAPYLKGNAPDGAYICWMDIPAGTPENVSRGGWVRSVFNSIEEAEASRA